MPGAVKILPNYTYEDYCHWEGRWEIIDGIPFAMAPSPRPLHQSLSSRIAYKFLISIENNNCSCEVYQPIDYRVYENTILQPDLLITCKPIEKLFLDFSPVLVVEILSPSTMLKDRNTKYEIYQKQGIRYYLIIDFINKTIETYELDKKGIYQLKEITEYILDDDCTIVPDLNSIWRKS